MTLDTGRRSGTMGADSPPQTNGDPVLKQLPRPTRTERGPADAADVAPLRGARRAWLVAGALAVVLTLLGLPAQVAEFGLQCSALEAFAPPALCVGYQMFWELALALLFFGGAALVFRARPHGWMPLLLSLLLLAGGATEPGMSNALVFGASPYVLPWLRPLVLLMRAVGVTGLLVLFYIFPDGRFVPRPTRWLALGWLAMNIVWLLAPDMPGNAISGSGWRAWVGFSVAHFAAWLGTGALALGYRFWRAAGPVPRQQIAWGGLGLTLAALGQLYYYAHDISLFGLPNRINPYDALATPVVRAALTAGGLLCLAVAVVRYRLWALDRLLNRTLVYGLLTGALVALYSISVTALGMLLPPAGSPAASLLASGLAAVLFQPLRQRLQRAINRLMYGDRDAPDAALKRLTARLEQTLHPDAVLPAIVETIGRGFKLPYVRVELIDDDGAAATYGQPLPPALRLPLVYQRETIGLLIVGARAPGEALSAADRRALAELAAHASVAASAVRLHLELQRSRERLRGALEEGRRRMRHNLHDGLGPALASQQFTLAAIEQLLPHNPAAAGPLLQALRAQSRALTSDVRRMVEDLRPPALDDLGLLGALQERLAAYRHAPLTVVLDAPEQLPPLPAATEVAAYYLVLEGVTNVARHAAASTCRVTLALDGALRVTVRDDGRGLPAAYQAGVGVRSMRERVRELGGSWRIGALPGGGTEVVAALPLGDEQEQDEP